MNDSGNDSKGKRWFLPLIVSLLFLILFMNLIRPRIHGYRRTAMIKAAQTQIAAVATALDMFKADNSFYPTNKNGLNDLIVKPENASTNWHPYLDNIPLDPWDHPYRYEYPGRHNTNSYDLSSAGPDGKFGTEDDIVNWDSKK